MKTTGRAFCACIIIAVFTLIPACKKKTDVDVSKKETGAVVLATGWLNLIDEGKYAQSWDETAAFFKKAVPREKWTRLMASARKPFGTVLIRTLDSRKYATSLPGAPDGEYVVITFKTKFHNKKNSVETVTPMKDADGKWRVSGYYIK